MERELNYDHMNVLGCSVDNNLIGFGFLVYFHYRNAQIRFTHHNTQR